MTVRWITPTLGTCAWGQTGADAEAVVDVRSLRDSGGNSPALLAEKIAEIGAHLRAGRRTVVCCDHGMSRSNALAAAALAQVGGTGFAAALELVLEAADGRAIRVDLLGEIRKALGETEHPEPAAHGQSVLICGGSGFIADAVRAALARLGLGTELTATPVVPLRLEQAARSSGARCLVFLARPAALNSNEGLGQLLSELRGALEVCRAGSLRLLFLSGHQVYAGYHGAEPRPDEDLPPRPDDAAGEALCLAERMIELHGERYGVEALVVRACALYGPGDNRPGFLRTFVEQAIRGEVITVHRYRNGPPCVDLLHVRDFAAGIALAARQRLKGRVHLGSGRGIATPALAQTIARLTGSGSPVRPADLPGDAANVILDCARAGAVLGWAAETALEDGLTELIADLRTVGAISGDIQS